MKLKEVPISLFFCPVLVLTTLMKIYTKGGDAGETSLWGGARVPKDDLRIRTYGTLDELNAFLGVVLTDEKVALEIRQTLLRIQGELFQLGSELATPRGKKVGTELIEDLQIQALEKQIDAMETQMKPLKTFILPGGTQAAAWVHLARTVSRRAERELVTLNRAEPVRPAILQYINRLSDFLFVMARYLNHLQQVDDIPWVSAKK